LADLGGIESRCALDGCRTISLMHARLKRVRGEQWRKGIFT
jgi:hypothetical protein